MRRWRKRLWLVAIVGLAALAVVVIVVDRRSRQFEPGSSTTRQAIGPAELGEDGLAEPRPDPGHDLGEERGEDGFDDAPVEGSTGVGDDEGRRETYSSAADTRDITEFEPAYADAKGVEQVSWSEALEWWPYAGVLRATDVRGRPRNESVFAATNRGGVKGDARKETSTLIAIYWGDGASPDERGIQGLKDDGAIMVQVAFFPPGEGIPFGETSRGQEPVVVRGHAARMLEMRRKANANVDWRAIRWEAAAPGGGTLQWEISNHPDLYTVEETVGFINRLEEIQ